jgi:hypothetical protein
MHPHCKAALQPSSQHACVLLSRVLCVVCRVGTPASGTCLVLVAMWVQQAATAGPHRSRPAGASCRGSHTPAHTGQVRSVCVCVCEGEGAKRGGAGGGSASCRGSYTRRVVATRVGRVPRPRGSGVPSTGGYVCLKWRASAGGDGHISSCQRSVRIVPNGTATCLSIRQDALPGDCTAATA